MAERIGGALIRTNWGDRISKDVRQPMSNGDDLVELRQIRQFVMLAETLNFRRAAKALNMTQPPLSLSMQKLEAELGVRLFERHSRGVSLTEAARAALTSAREALASVEALVQNARDIGNGERGRLRVGYVGSATYGLVPTILPLFRSRHPAVELALKEATGLEMLRGLEDGTLDVGLVRTPLLEAVAPVSLELLYMEPLMLLVPLNHRLAVVGRVRLEDLKDEPFVIYDRLAIPNLRSLILMACEAAGFSPNVAEETADNQTMIALVESGAGLALAPAVMRRAAAGRAHCLELLSDGRPLQIGFALAKRQDDHRPAVEAFAAAIREVAKAISPAYR